ncbi:MAG TPA: prephenate dehydrogenase/arogenate dehydrogenase family protein, partial [Gaiella sp.]|nr:prephenate dehydrogenase/arogenate dehydrogenase family protein [Gaiella sp.]
MTANRLAVIGTGLIGASAALAARRAGVRDVVGWDPDSEALAIAVERRAVDAASNVSDAVADADLVLAAVPVGELPITIRDLLDRAPAGCTITDVGSTKGPVCAAAGDDPRFVGGHPICGAETRGPD